MLQANLGISIIGLETHHNSGPNFNVAESIDNFYSDYIKSTEETLKATHTVIKKNNSRRSELFAEIWTRIPGSKEKRLVATVDNNGYIESQFQINFTHPRFNVSNIERGPELAAARATLIADELDAEVLIKDSALTNEEYQNEPEHYSSIVDFEKMHQDSRWSTLLKIKHARELFISTTS